MLYKHVTLVCCMFEVKWACDFSLVDSDKFRNASTAAQAQVQKDLKKRKRKGKKGKNKAVETGFEDRDDVHIEVKRSSSDGPSIHPWLYLFDDRQPLPSSEFSRNKVGRRKGINLALVTNDLFVVVVSRSRRRTASSDFHGSKLSDRYSHGQREPESLLCHGGW